MGGEEGAGEVFEVTGRVNSPPPGLLEGELLGDAAHAAAGALETLPPAWRVRPLAEAAGRAGWACILVGSLKDVGGQ